MNAFPAMSSLQAVVMHNVHRNGDMFGKLENNKHRIFFPFLIIYFHNADELVIVGSVLPMLPK